MEKHNEDMARDLEEAEEELERVKVSTIFRIRVSIKGRLGLGLWLYTWHLRATTY
jgi:DNA polymerase/3'-5' exonuclease PolX